MKNKEINFNNLKRNALYAVLAAVIFCGCQHTTQNETMQKEPDIFKFGIQTIEHDSCEYVLFKDNGRSDVEMLHKANCKYCTARSKK